VNLNTFPLLREFAIIRPDREVEGRVGQNPPQVMLSLLFGVGKEQVPAPSAPQGGSGVGPRSSHPYKDQCAPEGSHFFVLRPDIAQKRPTGGSYELRLFSNVVELDE